jgi:hypothetical protein
MTSRDFTKELLYMYCPDYENGDDTETIHYPSLIHIITELCDRIEKLEAKLNFFLSQEENVNLRNSNEELTAYGKQKIKELLEKEKLRITQDDLSDLFWLVRNYGHKLEEYPGENQVENLTVKLQKMLNQMG